MLLTRGITLIAGLVIALCLSGCKTDDSFKNVSETSATESTATAAPLWKGRPPAASSTSEGITPSFNSGAQNATYKISPSQQAGSVRDPSAVKAAQDLAVVAKPGTASYKIGPQDVLDISVFQAPEISGTVEVAEDGTVDLPLIGEVPVAGKTSSELQRDLNAKLGAKYLQNPQVTVRVKEYNSNRVTVSGAVKSPGVFPYKGESLLQFVVKAGGLAPDANSMVLVLREIDGKRSAAKFNLADIQSGQADDPTMKAGDVVVADTSVVKRGLNSILKVLPLAGFATLL
jgi:polysaccharide export outer membrane protein